MRKKPLLATAILTVVLSISAQAAVYSANGNSGFGGVLNSLEITDDGTNIQFVLTTSAPLNDKFVIYIDSIAGGETNTSGYTDTGDDLRKAISGFDGINRSTVNFASGFEADYALALDGGFGGAWDTVNGGSHGFVTTVNSAPGGTTASPYTMTLTLAQLGLSPGDSFRFVGTLVSATAFRSDEAFGPGIPSGNPGSNPVTFSDSFSYTSVPEPAMGLLGALGVLGILRRRI